MFQLPLVDGSKRGETRRPSWILKLEATDIVNVSMKGAFDYGDVQAKKVIVLQPGAIAVDIFQMRDIPHIQPDGKFKDELTIVMMQVWKYYTFFEI